VSCWADGDEIYWIPDLTSDVSRQCAWLAHVCFVLMLDVKCTGAETIQWAGRSEAVPMWSAV
jgi:hypothetical protein